MRLIPRLVPLCGEEYKIKFLKSGTATGRYTLLMTMMMMMLLKCNSHMVHKQGCMLAVHSWISSYDVRYAYVYARCVCLWTLILCFVYTQNSGIGCVLRLLGIGWLMALHRADAIYVYMCIESVWCFSQSSKRLSCTISCKAVRFMFGEETVCGLCFVSC